MSRLVVSRGRETTVIGRRPSGYRWNSRLGDWDDHIELDILDVPGACDHVGTFGLTAELRLCQSHVRFINPRLLTVSTMIPVIR